LALSLFNEKCAEEKRDKHEGEHHLVPHIFPFEEIEEEDEGHVGTNDSVKGEYHFFSLSVSI
jgi:hypothetical protein